MTDIVSVNEFLAGTISRGPKERRSPSSEFTSHEAADMDVKFLLSLAKRRHSLSHVMCIPDFYICKYNDSRETILFTRKKTCPLKNLEVQIRAGIVVTDMRDKTKTKLWLPKGIESDIFSCGKRFVVSNFGIYPQKITTDSGHSNSLIFDTRKKTIERFEPFGRMSKPEDDSTLSRLFLSELKGWRYVGTESSAPDKGPQWLADSFSGMCVTFSLLYVLLRLLNPQKTPRQINTYIVEGKTNKELKDTVLRLNRHVADTLRGYERGDLVRKGRNLSGTRCRK